MSAEIKDEQMYFILPEHLENLKKNKNTPEIEQAIKNVEWLQRQNNDSFKAIKKPRNKE
jgi:hypothetical protein